MGAAVVARACLGSFALPALAMAATVVGALAQVATLQEEAQVEAEA
jgi:hypothetical protein